MPPVFASGVLRGRHSCLKMIKPSQLTDLGEQVLPWQNQNQKWLGKLGVVVHVYNLCFRVKQEDHHEASLDYLDSKQKNI